MHSLMDGKETRYWVNKCVVSMLRLKLQTQVTMMGLAANYVLAIMKMMTQPLLLGKHLAIKTGEEELWALC